MTDASVSLPPISAETIKIPLMGTAPLIINKFTEKAKQTMLDSMQGKKAPKTIRNPQADYEAALYRLPGEGGYGFPVLGFKAATVSGARFFGKSVSMTMLRQCLFVTGELSDDGRDLLCPITGEPKMRDDVVRVGMGKTDLRFRPEFTDWSALLTLTYVTSMIDRQSVLALVDAGGMGVGVGEWRPEKKGQNGTYRVDESRPIEVL